MLWTPLYAQAACKQVKAESDILGIRIADEASSERVLGPLRELSSEQDKTAEGAYADFPFVRVRSADGKQDAKLFEHYGAVVGAYSEIEVRPADRPRGPPSRYRPTSSPPSAASSLECGGRNSSACLGLASGASAAKDSETIIMYAINDPKHALLMRSGMPSYFARYAFKDDRLAWFRFGFEYP
jgi:hypothetical protein